MKQLRFALGMVASITSLVGCSSQHLEESERTGAASSALRSAEESEIELPGAGPVAEPVAEPPPPPPEDPPSEPGAFAIDEAVKRAVDSCITTVDYNRLGYSYAPAGETYTHRSGSTAWKLASYLGSVSLYGIDKLGWIDATNAGQGAAYAEGEAFLNATIAKVNAKFASEAAAGRPFQSYQKVCLAQCISSRIIDYAADILSKYGGASLAVARGVGVCTEFASIANRIVNATASDSVSSWVGLSPGHAFLQVSFDGNTYSIEPQHDPAESKTCRFYKPEATPPAGGGGGGGGVAESGGGTYVLYPSWEVDMGGGRWERTCVSIDDKTDCEWHFVE